MTVETGFAGRVSPPPAVPGRPVPNATEGGRVSAPPRRRGGVATRAMVVTLLLSGSAPSAPASSPAETVEIDPCAHVYGQADLNACWAREADRADAEMEGVYLALRQQLPRRAASSLEKAQRLWREFRDAHVATQFGVDDPRAVWGREYPMCVLIARYVMSRERTRELRRLQSPSPDTVCPL